MNQKNELSELCLERDLSPPACKLFVRMSSLPAAQQLLYQATILQLEMWIRGQTVKSTATLQYHLDSNPGWDVFMKAKQSRNASKHKHKYAWTICKFV